MKPIFLHVVGAIGVTFATAACVPTPQTAPAPVAAATATPATYPQPQESPLVPTPTASNWADLPQSPGMWRYIAGNGTSSAQFGGTVGEPQFSIECSLDRRSVTLFRYSPGLAAGASVTIRTETATRTLATGLAKNAMAASVSLSASDQLLDAMALTRGRFAVELEGARALYLPNWAEVTRVIEDCR